MKDSVTHVEDQSSHAGMTLGDEAELVAGMLRNEDDCILRFVRVHEDRVMAQAYRMLQNRQDAEEVCQDVFVKALRRLRDFKGNSKLSTWLYSIAYTTCIDALKKRKRNGHEVDVDEDRMLAWADIGDALTRLEAKEQREIIDTALANMNETEALLLDLYYLQDLPTHEIKEITSLSEGNIRIKLMRARKKLAAQLIVTLPQETIELYRHGRQ